MTKAAGVVLAGGQATRMGESNKALLKVGGLPLIERVVTALAPLVSRVIIVANDPAPFRYLGLKTIPDAVPAGGAMAGLLAGLREARQPVLATGCDLPFVSGPLAIYLMENLPGWDAVVPKCPEGFQPLFAVYGPGCVELVRQAVDRGERRLTSFYPGLAVRHVEGLELVPFEPERAFFNINTPADLALARRMAESELPCSNYWVHKMRTADKGERLGQVFLPRPGMALVPRTGVGRPKMAGERHTKGEK